MLITWEAHHGRTEALGRLLGLERVYIHPKVRRFGPRLLSTAIRYLLSSVLTVVRLLRARSSDEVVIVVAPPVFPVLLAKLLVRPTRLIIDAHSGAFVGERWKWSLPLLRWSCRGSRALIVTNEEILQGRAMGCEVIVLHDPFEEWDDPGTSDLSHVLVPLGGGDDEPVQAITDAVRNCEVPFVFSGRTSPEDLPTHAKAVGFLSSDEYRELVFRARVVVGMTNRDFTMQRVGYEALFAGRAFVTADFEVLRRFFGDAAVYVRPEDADSIARGVQQAWRDAESLAENMRALRELRSAEQADAVARLRRSIGRTDH